MYVSFDEWTRQRKVASWGTNAGAPDLPFQKWRHFKEAFAPELVARAIAESKVPVKSCIDPFGGSGTTALACQFLGVRPETIEVNPFLADLIEAKLSTYVADDLARDLGKIIRRFGGMPPVVQKFQTALPPTFVEPGIDGRWIFDLGVAERIAAIITALEELDNLSHRRLFRVLLAGILIEVSNVVVNGKGRRYRKGWESRRKDPSIVDELFLQAAQRAIVEIHRFSRRSCSNYEIKRGDARELIGQAEPADICIFSPPYPNSFDYTDVYNVELWILGYLSPGNSNQKLRESTLSSHVQVARSFSSAPKGSVLLDEVIDRLDNLRARLWDKRIPDMVGAYFADMLVILDGLKQRMPSEGSVWMVVGDSRYSEVHIRTADILAELVRTRGWQVEFVEPCRSMRASAQQGGQFDLSEDLLVVTNKS